MSSVQIFEAKRAGVVGRRNRTASDDLSPWTEIAFFTYGNDSSFVSIRNQEAVPGPVAYRVVRRLKAVQCTREFHSTRPGRSEEFAREQAFTFAKSILPKNAKGN